ncbi:MAG TPA: DUF3667 domain-containing protein, partial [Dokdonella sp.]
MNESKAIVPDLPEPPPAPPADAAPAAKTCGNCGTPLEGPYCYACGQPEKGMIRPLANVMSDVADTIFNVDSRIFRSILPLYFRPGRLTIEYFSGRRTRYVTPFRLFFFLCIISFFAVQASLDIDQIAFNLDDQGSLSSAQSETEVREREKAALDEIAKARNEPGMPAAAAVGLDVAAANIRTEAAKRSAWLARKAEAQARGEPPPPDPERTKMNLFGNGPWDPETNPLRIAWLPAFANAELNAAAARMQDNLEEARKDPRHLIRSLFSVLPQTLFVLMPLFAVLLKVVYVFYRRMYMEHLIVALHSHAFVFMSLLLVAILSMLLSVTGAQAVWADPVLKLLRAAVWTWLPVYLFLMQKRVYRHGWPMAV